MASSRPRPHLRTLDCEGISVFVLSLTDIRLIKWCCKQTQKVLRAASARLLLLVTAEIARFFVVTYFENTLNPICRLRTQPQLSSPNPRSTTRYPHSLLLTSRRTQITFTLVFQPDFCNSLRASAFLTPQQILRASWLQQHQISLPKPP